MKGLQKIKDTIKGDVDAQIKQIKKEAQKEANFISKEEKERLALETSAHEEETKLQLENLEHRTLAKARLDARKEYLSKREHIIQQLIEKATKAIDHNSVNYEKKLKQLTAEVTTSLGKDITLLVNKKDIVTMKKFTKLPIAETEIAGGVIAEDASGRRIDRSLEVLREENHANIRREIAKNLGE